jgi:hypothetical protein
MKHDWRGPTEKGLIDPMRVDPRPFWTEDELGLAEVVEILCKVRFLSPDDSRIVGKSFFTRGPFGRVVAHFEVPIDLYGSGKSFRTIVPQEIQCAIPEAEWNGGKLRM